MELTLICRECGRETRRNSPSQKFCPGCAINRRARLNEASRLRRKAEAADKALNGDQADQLNTLTIGNKRTARIVAEARAFGMTYGTYTAAIRAGSIERVLKAKGFTDPEAVLRELTIK